MRMRFFSSGGDFFSQRTLGTTPNMAPPSRRKCAAVEIVNFDVAEMHGWAGSSEEEFVADRV